MLNKETIRLARQMGCGQNLDVHRGEPARLPVLRLGGAEDLLPPPGAETSPTSWWLPRRPGTTTHGGSGRRLASESSHEILVPQ